MRTVPTQRTPLPDDLGRPMSTLSRPRLRASALALALAGALAACGGSSPTSPGAQSSGGAGSGSAAPAQKVSVDAAQFSWTAAALTNSILGEIAQRKPDLGVSGLKTTQLDPAAAWAGAGRGDVDLLTEVALPNQQKFADSAKGKVKLVSETYGGATQGWFVPKYVVDPGGPAAGLKSVTQLNDFKQVFDGKFYDADPGYVTTQQNAKRLKGYGIDFEHVVAGEAAELAQLKRAYDRKQPIVLYLYHPHAVFAQYDMVQLEEPTPYTDGCLTTGNGACAMPAYSANIALSDELGAKVPRFTSLLQQFRIPLQEMEAMQKQVDVDKKQVSAVAKGWVDSHGQQVDQWTAAK
ncbi:MAG: glycine/betaine ABC transporter substrate-binding protein [Actinomycetota bacterium]|nr:glycine/betaine ABC transporter substrate-binding protein [Actinomycetota bacterium]